MPDQSDQSRPVLGEYEQLAIQANTVERLRIIAENLDLVIELCPFPTDDSGAQLALRLLERERASLGLAIEALE